MNDPAIMNLSPVSGYQVWATRIAFLILGIGMAAWAPLIPYVKAELGASDGTLGLLLLCVGLGTLVTMPLAGIWSGRFGCRPVIWAGALAMCVALLAIIGLPHYAVVVPALLLFGGGIAAVDIAMNIQAVVIEQRAGRSIMSGFHGFYSLGGMLGAALVSILLGLTGSPFTSVAIAVALMVVVMGVCGRHLLNEKAAKDSSKFVFPHGIVLLIGILCFVVFMAEGVVLDWSAIFLKELRNVEPAQAGLGYVAFSLAMMLGRFSGDLVVPKLGAFLVIVLGGLIAGLGYLIVIGFPQYWMAYVGFALVGLGCSNIVPVLFTAAGNQNLMSVNAAITAVAGLGYMGILLGPALIGFISQLSSLTIAFAVIAAGLFLVAALGKRVTQG